MDDSVDSPVGKADPAVQDHLVNLGSKIVDLKYQVEGYRKEVAATRTRRPVVGVWAAVACAWLAAGAVSIIAILALADKSAAVTDGQIVFVVFLAFGTAIGATYLAASRGNY